MGGLLVGCSVRSCGRERRTADTVAARAGGGRSVAVASPASEEQRGPVMVTYRLYSHTLHNPTTIYLYHGYL